jgi:sulfur carrier protein
MDITLNGNPYDARENLNLANLVQSLDLKGRRVAVMLNEEVVKRERWSEVSLRPGDTVEVIQMVGGG